MHSPNTAFLAWREQQDLLELRFLRASVINSWIFRDLALLDDGAAVLFGPF